MVCSALFIRRDWAAPHTTWPSSSRQAGWRWERLASSSFFVVNFSTGNKRQSMKNMNRQSLPLYPQSSPAIHRWCLCLSCWHTGLRAPYRVHSFLFACEVHICYYWNKKEAPLPINCFLFSPQKMKPNLKHCTPPCCVKSFLHAEGKAN